MNACLRHLTSLLLLLPIFACKSTHAQPKVFGVGPAREPNAYSGVIKIEVMSDKGASFEGTAVYVRGDKGVMLFTARHVALAFGTPSKELRLTSGQLNILKVPTTSNYRVSYDLTPPNYGADPHSLVAFDYASVYIEDQTLFRTDITIESIKLAAKPAEVGDLLTIVGYGANDQGELGERRYGTNILWAIEGPMQVLAVRNPRVNDDGVLRRCTSFLCATYRRGIANAWKTHGAVGGPGDSGSPVLNTRGEMVGMHISGRPLRSARGAIVDNVEGYALNIHNATVGAFAKAEAAKIGVAFAPVGYDYKSVSREQMLAAANRLNSSEQTAPEAPPVNKIFSDDTGEVLFETVSEQADTAKATAEPAVGPEARDADRSAEGEVKPATPAQPRSKR